MVCTLIDNDNGHHTDQNVVDQRGTATPNHRRHCVTHWREQRCLYSYRELWLKWISPRSGRFKVCGNECLYCIYISWYWNSLPSVIFWKFILSGICIELLRNFRGNTSSTLTISHIKRRYKKAYHLTPKCLNSKLLHFALLHFPGHLHCIELLRNFLGGNTSSTLTISHIKRRYKKAYHLTPKCLNSKLLHFALLHFPGHLHGKQLAQYSLVSY